MNDFTGVVFSGGKSSRMGTDKAFLRFNGKLLIEYPLDLLQTIFSSIIISANSDKYFRFGYKVVFDEYIDCGPIGGLYSVLINSKSAWNFVIGCDTPFITRELIIRLTENTANYDCVLPVHNGKTEPLIALYNKSCLPAIHANIQAGIYKMQKFIDELKCNYIDVSDLLKEKPEMFMNFNSLSDFNKF